MPTRTCVILQPSYIPWRGYFHQIERADVFVFYDDVQYDKGGWRNRNRIKTPRGTEWITVPVHSKGNVAEKRHIDSIAIDNRKPWWESHAAKLSQSYAKAPYYRSYAGLLEEMYGGPQSSLADYTINATKRLAAELGIKHTEFLRSSQIPSSGQKTERLISILTELEATRYVSGPSARAYIDPKAFEAAGIALEYMNYDYAPYEQLHGEFDPFVSVVDLLFMAGPNAGSYIWGDGVS